MADEISNIIAGHVSEIAPDAGGDSIADPNEQTTELAHTGDAAESVSADKAPTDPPDELLTTEFKGNKYNRLPYSRVKSIVENARKKAADEHAAALAEHQAKIKEYETASEAYKREQQELREMAANPEQFLRNLALANPAYTEFVERALAKQQQQERQASQGRIEPDVVLPDGSFGYSQAAADRLYEQRLALAEQAMLEKLTKRFEPIENEFRARKAYEEMVPRVRQQLAAAQKWPLFTENQDAIRAKMEADRSLSLESAYREVVFSKLQSDRDKMRADILAEINAKSKAAASPSATPSPLPPASKDRSVEAIIREQIRKAG